VKQSARHVLSAIGACLLAGCSSAPPSRALHIVGKGIDVSDRPASRRWTFHLEGGQDQEVVLRFTLNGEPVSFGSASCRKEGATLLLEPLAPAREGERGRLEGVGEILIPAPVLEEGITAAFSLSPEESRSDPSGVVTAERGYTISVSFQLDGSAGAWVPAAGIPLPAAPFERIGFGHTSSAHVPRRDMGGGELLFLSLYGEAMAYFEVRYSVLAL
jgi:hypothetical protein